MGAGDDPRSFFARHVRAPLRDFFDLAARGGVVIETEEPAGARVVASTTVQLDGDLVTKLDPGIRPESIDRHYLEVRRRLRKAEMPVRVFASALLTVASLSSTLLAMFEVVDWRGEAWDIVLGLLLSGAAGAGAWLLLQRLLAILLRLLAARAFRRFLSRTPKPV